MKIVVELYEFFDVVSGKVGTEKSKGSEQKSTNDLPMTNNFLIVTYGLISEQPKHFSSKP